MPDSRTVFDKPPAGFAPGTVGRLNENVKEGLCVANGYQYRYHVTIEAVDGQMGHNKPGIKIKSFHVSFYGTGNYHKKKYGMIVWNFDFASDSYLITEYTDDCKATAAASGVLRTKAMARVLKRCKFGCAIPNPFAPAAVVPVAVAAAPALPAVAAPAAAAIDADPGAPGAPIPVGGPAAAANLAVAAPPPVVNPPIIG